jgi:hypothetical protein
MVQKVNNLGKSSRRAVIAKDRRELMKEALRLADEIRESLKGRKHSDSTKLIAEDRMR